MLSREDILDIMNQSIRMAELALGGSEIFKKNKEKDAIQENILPIIGSMAIAIFNEIVKIEERKNIGEPMPL